MTTDTFRRADHRPVPTSVGEAEATPVALRAPWYRLAAAQGNAGAQNNFGLMYANGHKLDSLALFLLQSLAK